MLILSLGLSSALLAAAPQAPVTPKPKPATESRPQATVTIPTTPIPSDRDKKSASRPAESRPATALYHERVQVVLRNQQKFNGIVKSNRFAEVESGMGFRNATKTEPDAGLRLWFAHKGHNWLFVRYNEIQSVNVIGRVSDIEVREMEARLDAELDARIAKENVERAAEIGAEIKARNDARVKEETAAEELKKAEAARKKKEAIDKSSKLMDRYPEELGWGEERKKEILARKNNHIYPTPEEAEFLQLFPEWLKAKQILDKAQKEADGEPVDEGDEIPGDEAPPGDDSGAAVEKT